MTAIQTKWKNTAGFTLVELMVVILIITLLLALGNLTPISQRREKARLEEIAVQMVSMIDQEKTNALLGRTEDGEIVRKRKIIITTDTSILDALIFKFNSYFYLANEANPSQTFENHLDTSGTSSTSKTWQLYDPQLIVNYYSCDSGNATQWVTTWVTMIFDSDKIEFKGASPIPKHLVIFIARDMYKREVHMDSRTGVTYERDSIDAEPKCN